MSTRRTRNMGASPGGFHELPVTTRQSRRSRKEPKPKDDVVAEAASTTQATYSEAAKAPILKPQTPPPTTSRSQSPHLETESDSPAQIPESRSTSPPAENTISSTQSMPQNNSKEQKKQVKRPSPSKRASKVLTKNLKRNRSKPDPSDEASVEESDDDGTGKQRSAKRLRTGAIVVNEDAVGSRAEINSPARPRSAFRSKMSSLHRTRNSRNNTDNAISAEEESDALFLTQLINGGDKENTSDAGSEESSFSDFQVEATRVSPVKLSQQRSRTPETNNDITVLKKSSSVNDNRAEESLTSSVKPQQRRGLTPKPTRRNTSTQVTGIMRKIMTDDMAVREEILRTQYGLDMAPMLGKGGRLPAPGKSGRSDLILDESYIEDDEEEEFNIIERPPLAIQYSATRQSEASIPQSEATLTAMNSKSKATRPSGSSKPVRGMLNYYEHNPRSCPPTASEVQKLLTRFDAEHAVKISSAPTPSKFQQQATEARRKTITSPDELQPFDFQSDVVSSEIMAHQHAKGHAVLEGASEVQPEAREVQTEASEVQTKAPESDTSTPQQSQAQEGRGWFSGVSSLFSPMKIFGRRIQSAEAASTNGDLVVGVSNEHLPQRSDFAVPLTTPTSSRNRGPLFPQSERRRSIIFRGKSRPKTERHLRFADREDKRPIHMRGVLTSEEIEARWRAEDEDHNLKTRQDRRTSMQASVENEDETDPNQSAHAGEKRKDRHSAPRPANWNHGGTFSVPSPISSDQNNTPFGDVAIVDANRSKGLSTETKSSPQVGSSLLQELEPYDHRPWRTVYAKRFKQKHGRGPVAEVAGNWRWNTDNADDLDRSLLPHEFLDTDHAVDPDKPWSLYPRKGHAYKGQHFRDVYEPLIESRDPEKIADTLDIIEKFGGYRKPSGQFKASSYRIGREPAENWHPSPSLPTLGTSIRRNKYTGTLFAQPPNIQANLDEGKYPLAPRNATASGRPSPGNIFSASTSTQDIVSEKKSPAFATIGKDLMSMSVFELRGTVSSLSLRELQKAWSKVPVEKRAELYSALSLETQKKVEALNMYMPQPHDVTGYDSQPDLVIATAEPPTPVLESSNSGSLFNRITRDPNAATSSPTTATPISNPASNTDGQFSTSTATPTATTLVPSSGSLFGRISAPAGDSRIGTLATFASEPYTSKSTPATTTPKSAAAESGTFDANFYDNSDSDEDDAGDENDKGNKDEGHNTRKNVAGDASILQPKTWPQSPPPKPKPSHAQLPQVLAQPSAAELAKAKHDKLDKFKPNKPSGLRNVTQMSPLHSEQENRVREPQAAEEAAATKTVGMHDGQGCTASNKELWAFGMGEEQRNYWNESTGSFLSDIHNGFSKLMSSLDPEVQDAVNAIPDEIIIDTPFPPFLYKETRGIRFDPEVEREVMRLLP